MSKSTTETQRDNLERVERLLGMYKSEGSRVFLDHYDEFFHPAYVFRPAIAQLGGEVYRGRDGVDRWLSDMETIATDYTLRDIEIRAVGEDHLLILGQMHLTGRESGASFEGEYGWALELEDGLVISGRAFLSHAEAERAAAEAEEEAG